MDYTKLQEATDEKDRGVKETLKALGTSSALPMICLLGATKFQSKISEPLIKALAVEFKKELAGQVLVITGGMPGVQELMSRELMQGSEPFTPSVVHLMPQGEACTYKDGKVVHAGKDLDERKKIFGQIGSIYICIEGGPGVSKEAGTAYDRGAIVLPIKSTGGASSGMFDFPKGAFEKPDWATAEQWKQLEDKCPDDNVRGHTSGTAKVIVQLIKTLI